MYCAILTEQKRPIATDSDRITAGKLSADEYGRLRTIADDCGRLTFEEQKILLFLLDNEKISRKIAVELLSLQKTKVHEILSNMTENNLIIRQGKGRSTYYILATTDGES